jgi:hypothetical protein
MMLVPLFDLKFLNEFAADCAGTSNRRHYLLSSAPGAGGSIMSRYVIALIALLIVGADAVAPTFALPPPLQNAPGYDRRLQESRAALARQSAPQPVVHARHLPRRPHRH